MYSDYNDEELVSMLSQGDAKAFEAIYYRYVPFLFKYARKNIQSKEDCEEIIQEVFQDLWERRYESNIKVLKHYLSGMVRFKIIHHLRKSVLIKKYIDHFLAFEAVYDYTERNDPEEIYTLLHKSIEQLPERCREVLKLRLNEGLSNGDIAKRMNVTRRTVEGQLYLAFKHIRSTFDLSLN